MFTVGTNLKQMHKVMVFLNIWVWIVSYAAKLQAPSDDISTFSCAGEPANIFGVIIRIEELHDHFEIAQRTWNRVETQKRAEAIHHIYSIFCKERFYSLISVNTSNHISLVSISNIRKLELKAMLLSSLQQNLQWSKLKLSAFPFPLTCNSFIWLHNFFILIGQPILWLSSLLSPRNWTNDTKQCLCY